jgi:hypothetical protein
MLLLPVSLDAQSFFPVGGPLLEQEVAAEAANECYIFFDNPGGDSLLLRWRQLEVSMPAGWDIDLCDYGACYIGIPNNGTMSQVYDTIRPYLKLIVQPDTVAGTAWLWFRVYEASDPANYQDVYFSLHTSGTTGLHTPDPPAFSTYPNPVRDMLFLHNESAAPVPFRLADFQGRVWWRETIPPGTSVSISMAGVPPGWYLVSNTHSVQKILVRP